MSTKRVLVVEDEVRISNLLKLYLERELFAVEIANNGEDGLNKALDEHFDVIILDVFMPNKNGLEVLEEVRKVKDTPVLMLTAQNDPDAQMQGRQLGANGYILKPFSPKDIVNKIKELAE